MAGGQAYSLMEVAGAIGARGLAGNLSDDSLQVRGLASLAESSFSRVLVGDFSSAAPWQVDVLAAGKTPGGRSKRGRCWYGRPGGPPGRG